jgi:hypothetical protein
VERTFEARWGKKRLGRLTIMHSHLTPQTVSNAFNANQKVNLK